MIDQARIAGECLPVIQIILHELTSSRERGYPFRLIFNRLDKSVERIFGDLLSSRRIVGVIDNRQQLHSANLGCQFKVLAHLAFPLRSREKRRHTFSPGGPTNFNFQL